MLLIGRLDEAEQVLARLDPAPFPPASRAGHELVVAGIAMRRLRAKTARAALARAELAARHAAIPALTAEIESATLVLNTPAARLIAGGEERLLLLDDVEALLASPALIVDACRLVVREGAKRDRARHAPGAVRARARAGASLASATCREPRCSRRRSAPGTPTSRIARGCGSKSDGFAARFRTLADVSATARGFALVPRRAREVVVLARTVDEEHAALLALLSDGKSWSSSALALALGTSQRTVQRALDELAAAGQGAVVRSRAGAALDDAAGAGFPDKLVTPGAAAGRLVTNRLGPRTLRMESMKRSTAEIVREYGPFPGVDEVQWGHLRWSERLVCVRRPAERRSTRQAARCCARSMSPRMRERPSTAVTCFRSPENRIQKIDPQTGRVVATIPAPGGGGNSGLAWAEGALWVGQYRERKIHQIDPETGAVLRTIESNRFVTGVTWVDGELWHGTWEGDESELRQIDPQTGEVIERLEMPPDAIVSGLESDGADQFFCGGGNSGKLRAVRRPRSAAASRR